MGFHVDSKLRTVLRVASGNYLEMFDFMIFGYYASFIAATFFPAATEYGSLMLSLTTFGAGFLMRPIGAIVLGIYIDRHGRRRGLLMTLGLMSIGTLITACTPGYHTIGLFAPLLILIGRLTQGLSAGVELGGVSVYLSEIATPEHRGFYVSFQSASQQAAVVTAAILGMLIHKLLTPEALADWGWRIPLLAGCLIVPFLFVIRSSLRETETFLKKKTTADFRTLLRIIGSNWKRVTLGCLMATMSTVTFYMITAYTPTFGTHVLHLTAMDSLVVTFFIGLSNLVLLPLMGHLSDRIGRRPLLITATVLALLSAYPALLWLGESPTLVKLLGVELWLSLLYSSYNGAFIVYLTEIMPADVKTSGFSLAYSLATAIFGGFTPAISTYLVHQTGSPAAPGLWLSFAAACGLGATLAVKTLDVRNAGEAHAG